MHVIIIKWDDQSCQCHHDHSSGAIRFFKKLKRAGSLNRTQCTFSRLLFGQSWSMRVQPSTPASRKNGQSHSSTSSAMLFKSLSATSMPCLTHLCQPNGISAYVVHCLGRELAGLVCFIICYQPSETLRQHAGCNQQRSIQQFMCKQTLLYHMQLLFSNTTCRFDCVHVYCIVSYIPSVL